MAKTKQEILQKIIKEEYSKCVNSPIYTIEKYFSVMDLTQGGRVKYKLFPRQKDIIECYIKHRHNLVTKPRQAGISTTTAAFLACKLAFCSPKRPEKVMIIANKATLAEEFLYKIKGFLQQIPKWAWGGKYDNNKQQDGHVLGKGSVRQLKLVNGCEVKAVATSTDALRGYTPTYLVVDEAAFIDNGKELYAAAMSSLITGGRMILISTPNGLDELYHRTYADAIKGAAPFNILELKWWQDPRYNKDLVWKKYDEKGVLVEEIVETIFNISHLNKMFKDGYKPESSWYLNMCASLKWDKRAIARELDVKFEGSAGNVIDYEIIEYHESKTIDPILTIEEFNDKLWIWETYDSNCEYVAGVDVGSGSDSDYHSLKILNVTTMTEAVEYKGRIDSETFAIMINDFCTDYNAYTVVDTTGGYGETVVLTLEKLGFLLLHYSERGNDIMKKNRVLDDDDKKKTAGIKITPARRHTIYTNYVRALTNKELYVKSIRHVSEMKTLIWKNDRPDHMKGYNDDTIFATALALWIFTTHMTLVKKSHEDTKNILNYMAGKRKQVDESNKNTDSSIIQAWKRQGTHTPSKRKYRSAQDPTGEHSWVLGIKN